MEFSIGVRGPKCLNDGPTRWYKKFSDRFSRFDTIPAVTDTQPPSHPPSQLAKSSAAITYVLLERRASRLPARHVAVAITLNAKASSLKKTEGNVRGG